MIRTRWFSVFITVGCWYYARAVGCSCSNCENAMSSTIFGLPARHWNGHCRNKRRGFGIVVSLQLSAVRFYDTADAVQTKAIMPLSDVAQRFPPPILRIRRENCLRFIKAEEEPPIADSGFSNQRALATIVLESVDKKLNKYFLE